MENLFRQVAEIVQNMQAEQDASRKRGEQFNIFAACGVNHYEVTHSSIIAELLNPIGSHGQGTLFLEAFLTLYHSDFTFFLNEGASVTTEHATTNGRIDILITNRRGQAIIIENKIYAQDQYEQLKRYNHYAQEHYGKGNYEILYLTLHGDCPSEGSIGGDDITYRTISYSLNIVEWLEDCIKLCARIPMVRETLIQYQNHILNLTGKDMNMKTQEEIYKSMAAHAEETATIVNAAVNGYLQYVYNKYVKEGLKEYASKRDLILYEHNNMNINEGFYLQHRSWNKTCIQVAIERGIHYIGISCTTDGGEEDLATLPLQQMDCFEGKPNAWWPYGWSNLEQYADWSASSDTIPAMIDGRFVTYIEQTIDTILNELRQKNFKMI